MSGDTTSVNPAVMSAGSWKHSDFPAPVGSTARTLRPASSGPSTFSWWIRSAGWPNRSRRNTRAVASPPGNGEAAGDMGQELKRAPRGVRGPKHASGGETMRLRERSGLVAPVHAVAPAAFLARHLAGTTRDVLAIVTTRAHTIGLELAATSLGQLTHAVLRLILTAHHQRI